MYPMSADLKASSLAFVLLFATTILHALVDTVEAKGHINFGYDGAHGPQHWAEDYDTCFGKHQSPINIEEHIVRDVSFPPLLFAGLDLSRRFYLLNNGHTALLHAPNSSEQAYMSGGPLKGIYAFEQLHFHWGENDLEGSEDLINNHSFAMELHAVFYKDQYGSINEAVKYPDRLAVLAFFFEAEASDRLNPTFHPIVAALPKIEKVGSEIQLHQSMRLEHLLNPAGPLSDRMQNYFTYNGSLTTPPCSEVVVWIDFKHPLYLSHSQLESFRSISSSEGQKLTHNFRPVQPLSDRLVLHNLPGGPWNSRFDQPYWSAAGPTTTATTSFALLFLAFIVLFMFH
ncbi:carbonic anhydrase 2-like [Trichogramma pretiosum]|uniref:carbonic anhydrase 2-like n=1 Tax=Trichogramma pretiosum TaxID=7493 RepID=UPI0006C94C13|nr:carbonic anhydrase 2-like [Trichogramma pretiosum]